MQGLQSVVCPIAVPLQAYPMLVNLYIAHARSHVRGCVCVACVCVCASGPISNTLERLEYDVFSSLLPFLVLHALAYACLHACMHVDSCICQGHVYRGVIPRCNSHHIYVYIHIFLRIKYVPSSVCMYVYVFVCMHVCMYVSM